MVLGAGVLYKGPYCILRNSLTSTKTLIMAPQFRMLKLFSLMSLGAGLTLASNASTPDYNKLTVAPVRSAPVNWPSPILNKNWTGVSLDLNSTINYSVELINEAASRGGSLVVFHETWFPG